MKADDGEPAEEAPPGEDSESSGRVPAVVLSVIAAVGAWRTIVAFPEVAYVVVGSLGTVGVQKARARWGKRRAGGQEEPPEETARDDADIILALHRLAAPHVFLSSLAADLNVTKEDARAWLEELHIPVRRAVRVGSTTGVGVHRDDIPPLPQPLPEGAVGGVDLQQPTNQQRGIRVERTAGGYVIYDLADTHRHTTVSKKTS